MSIIPRLKKPLEGLTQIEKEEAVKRLYHEEEELLDTMGQESDQKAVSTVQEYVKDRDKDELSVQEYDLESLTEFTKDKQRYQRYLINILNRFVKQEELPSHYQLNVESNDQGIVISIAGTQYYGAFRVSGLPKYDINACKMLAVQLGNTISRLEGNITSTDSGILVPSGNEAKIAFTEAKNKWHKKHRK